MTDKGLCIPHAVLKDGQLGSTQKIVYAVMLANADEENVCRLSAEQIGGICGITHVAAQNSRLKLCSLGYAELICGTQRNYRLLKHIGG